MRIRHARLRAKGWTDEEIAQAEESLKRAEERKHPALSWLEKAVFWGLLFLTVVGIFTVSLVLVPLLVVLDTAMLALILALLGICLGSLFAIIIPDIEWVERKHHALNILVIAAVAVINVRFIVTSVDRLSGAAHNPWILGAVFAVALLAPYLFHLVGEEAREAAQR